MSLIKIELNVINKLFPFYCVVDNRGTIVELGSSLQKLITQSSEGLIFEDLFKIRKPENSSFSELMQSTKNEMIILKMTTPSAEFMGQLLPIQGNEFKLFVLNLVVQSPDELTCLNLDFNDFAIQDPIFDYLMLLQTQKRAIKQADEANRKLIEAHRVAVKASETKSQFLANMSHELRTPMNGILGMGGILQETTLDDEQKDYVQTLMTSGEAMLSLINDILDLSKIEAGFVKLDFASFEIEPLVREVCNTVLPTVQKKKIELEVSIAADVPPHLTSDRSRMRQVILNLVGNAVKFTLDGKVCVSVGLDGKKIKFSISDTGVGMNAETIKNLFSPFVQGDSSMTKKFEGTGLGLAICKNLIEAMDGHIEVQSTEGIGSTFTATFPIA